MQSLDVVSIILVLLGSIMVYGSKNILKILKFEVNDNKILILKLTGLLVACIGIFRILDII